MKVFPSCILATCVVPWDERGQFLEDLFRDQVRQLLTHCTRNLYIFGTAGEGYAVSDRQFDTITRVFYETMRQANADPMVGVISLSLTTIIERIERARDLGVRQFQISLPSWGPLTERELFEFFEQTCGRFPDCQFLHYNLLRTKRLVTPAEYGRLAERHENLVATKNSTDSLDRIGDLLLLAPQLQHFFTETGYAFGSLIGDCGFLASVATTNWESAKRFFEAGTLQNAALLVEMQQELVALTRDLLDVVGHAAHIDGAFDKLLWKLHDSRFPLRLLPPYTAADDSCAERLAALIREKYPRWAAG